MNDVEVLEAVFTKVRKNGYKGDLPAYDDSMSQWYVSNEDGGYVVPSITEIILSHEFAKALWGEGKTVYRAEIIESPVKGEAGFDEYLDAWQYHGTQLWLAEDRVDYLREHA